jgi:hypothetical protein
MALMYFIGYFNSANVGWWPGYQRPFGEVRGRAAQEVWVNDLVAQLHRVLARYTAPVTGAR